MSNAITVAVVDSGANAPHPHLSEVAGGVAFDFEGQESMDYVDRLGHGTAAAAAVHAKAPGAEIYVLKIFDKQLKRLQTNNRRHWKILSRLYILSSEKFPMTLLLE